MRASGFVWAVAATIAPLAMLCSLSACGGRTKTAAGPADFESTIEIEEDGGSAGVARDPGSTGALADQADAYARQIDAGARSRVVRWLDPALPAGAAAAEGSGPDPDPHTAPDVAPASRTDSGAAGPAAGAPVLTSLAPATEPGLAHRDTALRTLRGDLVASDQPAMRRALQLAALDVAVGGGGFDPAEVPGLDPAQAERVRAYHRLVGALQANLADGPDTPQQIDVDERLADLFKNEPIRIATLQLVRRVASYGSYEAFAASQFQAGREIPLIVYVELESFRAIRRSDERFEVKLTQQVELYTHADGAPVWRQDPEQVLDVSQRRRRDFFTCQLIRLPANLGVGQYLLKIRVNDVHGGTVAERSVPIVLVAGPALAAGGPERNAGSERLPALPASAGGITSGTWR